jgi:hypothetical protein
MAMVTAMAMGMGMGMGMGTITMGRRGMMPRSRSASG